MRHMVLLAIPALTLAACSDNPGGIGELELAAPVPTPLASQMANIQNGNPFLGVWRLTGAVQAEGEVELPADFSLILTFGPGDAYSISVTNTVDDFVCQSPETSCTVSGTYEYTATTITFTEVVGPHPGPDTGAYTFCGGRLVYLDYSEADDGVSLIFGKTRRDCYVRDCL
jgi:hypothetical protein